MPSFEITLDREGDGEPVLATAEDEDGCLEAIKGGLVRTIKKGGETFYDRDKMINEFLDE